MESKYDVVAAWCKCNKIVLAMTTDEYQRSGKPEIDAFFDMGYKIGRTTKAVARNLFGCECASQNASTSDEALPIADVVGVNAEQFYCFDSSKDGGYKSKCDAQCDYCRRICPQ